MKTFGAATDRATAYCTYCPKLCRFSCPAAEAENRETVTPWALMRLLENARHDAVELNEEVAETFYHCMLCKRCETWCKHDNDVPKAMLQAREWARDEGFVPEVLDGFVDFFAEANSPHPESRNLDEFPEIGSVHEIFDYRSRTVYMPDCETRHHYPQLVLRVGKLLHKLLGYRVRLFTRDQGEGFACCGFPLLAAGAKREYDAHRTNMLDALGPTDLLITDCAASVAMTRNDGSLGQGAQGPKTRHMLELLADLVEDLPVLEKVSGDGVFLHDSCFVGRHLNLYDETRVVAAAVLDGFQEFQFNREDAPCCGGPAHYHVVAPAASERAARERVDQLEREGGTRVVCGSATCKKSFRRAKDNKAASDLLEIICEACGV